METIKNNRRTTQGSLFQREIRKRGFRKAYMAERKAFDLEVRLLMVRETVGRVKK